MAQAHWVTVFTNDVRHLLPDVRVPTLVLHRANPAVMFMGVAHGRYLADHIPGARYVELPGADSLYWVGDTRQMLDEIEEFVTGVRGGLRSGTCLGHRPIHGHRRVHRPGCPARGRAVAGPARPSRPERARSRSSVTGAAR